MARKPVQKKTVSPVVAVIAFVVVAVILVLVYKQVTKPKGYMEQTPEIKQIQSEMAEALKKTDGRGFAAMVQRRGGGFRNRMEQGARPRQPQQPEQK